MSGFDLIIKPDEEEPGAAEVLVDGTIGGHSYRFLLDTGAAVSAVVCDDYTQGFGVVSARESHSAFSRGSQDIIAVPEMSVGSITKTKLEMVRFPAGVPGRRNLIGMNLLKDYRMLFDFKHNRVEIDPSLPVTENNLRPLATSARHHPFVEVDFGGVVAEAVWDTGASMSVVDFRFVEANPGLFRHLGATQGTDSRGTSEETPLLVMKACHIGGARFSAHKIAQVDLSNIRGGSDTPMDMILGYNLIHLANWWFDFPGKRWVVLKNR